MPDNADSPQDPPPPSLFVPRSVTALKSEQALKGEVHSMAHEKMWLTPKEQLKFSNLYKQKSRENIQQRVFKGVG